MNKPTLTYIGHATIKIKSADGHVLYIDPSYREGDYSDVADVLLVTHGHDDHMPSPDVKVRDGGTIITWAEAHPDENTYETFEVAGFIVEAVPASNSNHDIRYCVGYIVTVDGIKIYHAGDTSMLSSMAELKAREIDYALYPIDGQYNMGAVEASEAAKLVGARHNIPIHEFDQEGKPKKSEKFLPEGRMLIGYGETIEME